MAFARRLAAEDAAFSENLDVLCSKLALNYLQEGLRPSTAQLFDPCLPSPISRDWLPEPVCGADISRLAARFIQNLSLRANALRFDAKPLADLMWTTISLLEWENGDNRHFPPLLCTRMGRTSRRVRRRMS